MYFFPGGQPRTTTGLLILSGLIVFVTAEKSFTVIEKFGERQLTTPENNNINGYHEKHIKNNKKHVSYATLITFNLITFFLIDNRIFKLISQQYRQFHPWAIFRRCFFSIFKIRVINNFCNIGARDSP